MRAATPAATKMRKIIASATSLHSRITEATTHITFEVQNLVKTWLEVISKKILTKITFLG